jgi:hypothetical protein
MITEISQLISCRSSAKSENPRDHAAPGAPVPQVNPHTVLTVTTHR